MIDVNEEVGKILTAHLDIKQRADMAFAIANQVNAPVSFRNAIKAVQRALRDGELVNRRNQAVHGIHFSSDLPDAVNVEMHRGKGGRAPRLQTDKELSSLRSEINVVRTTFFAAVLSYLTIRFGKVVQDLDSFAAAQDFLLNISATKSADPESSQS